MYMYIRSTDALPFHSPSRRLHYERVSQLIVAVQVVTQYLHPLYPMYPIHNIHVNYTCKLYNKYNNMYIVQTTCTCKLMLYLNSQVYLHIVHAYSVLYVHVHVYIMQLHNTTTYVHENSCATVPSMLAS